MLQHEGPSTLQVAISEAKTLGLHPLNARRGQKQGSRGSKQKMEHNYEEKLAPTLALIYSKSLSWKGGN